MTTDDPASGIPGDDNDMSDPAAPYMGTLVIRTWDEPDQTPSFRARLTYSQAPDDVPGTRATTDPNEVLRLVREWLNSRPGSPRTL